LAGVLEGIGVTVDVPKAALEAFIWQAIANPKNVARMLLSGDLVSAERRLMDGAQLLRSVRGYPLDSDVALKLFEIDVVDAPLGSEAALTRLAIAGSIPQQLWEPIKVTLEQAEHLLRKVAEPNVALAGELVSVAGKLVSLVRQVEGWNAYENERRKILDNWKELLHGYSEMADAIATIAEQQEGIQRRTATGGLSTAREIELTKIATIVKVRGPMSFSPDSQLLAIVGDLPPEAAPRPHTDVIQIWRFPGCKLDKILVPPQELLTSRRNIASIAFSPDGRLLAVGWEEGLVDLWDVAEGRWREETLDLPFRTILGNTVPREIVSVAFSPDGRSVIIATATEIWVWNLETGKARVAFPLLPGAPRKLACFPKGAIVGAVSVGAAGKGWVMVWDWATGVVGRSVGPLGGTRFMPAYALAFSPDGRTLATGSRTPSDAYGAILLWDVQALLAGRVEYRYFVPDDIGVKVSDLAYFPNEDILAIAAGDRGFYTRVPGKITKWKDLKEAWHVAISPDGRLMAVIGSSVAVVYEVKRK
jgi:WD40 repeat protein